MELKNKVVFVTGAEGFIGSHLVEALVQLGCKVKALVCYNFKNDYGNLEHLPEETRKKIEIIPGDVRDPFMIRNAIKGSDVVFHLAALIAIPYSYIAPQSYVQTNVVGTLNVMQACLDEGVKKVIHTSTSECYGTPEHTPICEKDSLKAQSPYAASKVAADKIVESFNLSFNLPVVIIRPFNTFGPRQSARAVIPTIICQALTCKTIKLGTVDVTRDYTFVKDIVAGFIKAAESDKTIGETINLGSGKEISIKELAEKIVTIINRDSKAKTKGNEKEKITIEHDKNRIRPEKSEVRRLLADNSKAKKILGWKPQYSLEEGLEQTIAWIAENIKEYKPETYTL
jgi:NAD dependent epimerase/dehydratase